MMSCIFDHVICFRRAAGGGSTVKCPNHPNAFLVEDYRAGDMVCPECGLVVGDRYIVFFFGCFSDQENIEYHVFCDISFSM